MINNKERGRLRLSLRRGGISGQTGTIIIGLEGIMWGNQGLLIPRQLIQCSENLSVKFWRKLKMNHFLSGQIKWLETPQSAIKTSIATIIKNKDILLRTAEIYGITWINLSGEAN